MVTRMRGLSKVLVVCFISVPKCAFPLPRVQAPAPSAPEALAPLSAIPLQERQFTGTLDDFSAKLPSYVQKAASVGELPSRDYTDEVAYVSLAVSACLGQSALIVRFRTRTGMAPVRCDGTANVVPRPYGGFQRTLVFSFARTVDQQVIVSVHFRAYPKDPCLRGSVWDLSDNFGQYGIVLATLSSAASGRAAGEDPELARRARASEPPATPDGFRFLASIPANERLFEGSEREFERTLPNVLKNSVVAGNLLIDTYKNDLLIITDEVKRCREITKSMADSVGGKVWRLNLRYVPCDGNSHSAAMETFTTMNPHKRRLFMTVVPQPEGWGSGLIVTIDFQHLPADRLPSNVDVVPYFRVLQASIR